MTNMSTASKRPRQSPKKGVDKCSACGLGLEEDGKAVLCDGCELWLCATCLDMSDPEYELFTRMSRRLGSTWHCPRCKHSDKPITPEIIREIVIDSLATFNADLQNELEIKFQSLLKPLAERISLVEQEIASKRSQADLKQQVTTVVSVKVSKDKQSLFNEISGKIDTDLQSRVPVQDTNQVQRELGEIAQKQKNLILFGPEEDAAVNQKLQNQVDLKFINEELLRDCPVKCSFSVRLGRKQVNRSRPIKMIFKSPLDRDLAAFFLVSKQDALKTKIPNFRVSHDKSEAELIDKKKYDVLKKELNEKIAAGESGWKIKTRKNGPELVHEEPFRRQAGFEMSE